MTLRRLAPQRGVSLLGLLVIAVIVGFLALMAMRVFPSVNEYFTIKRAISQIMKNNPSSAGEVRSAFEKTIEVEYSIKTIGPNDLVIKPFNDTLRTTYAYNVEIPIVEPVFLLVKYSGSATGGTGR